MCTTKICNMCKTEKSIEEFPFRKKRGTYYSECKKCKYEKTKKWMKDNKEKILEYRKNYRKTEKSKEYQREYIKSEKSKEYQREYQQSEKYKQSRKKYREKNKEKLNNLNILWRKTDKGKASIIASSSKRRAIKRDGNVTSEQVLELKKNAKVCYWCKCDLKNVKVHIDHIFPLSKGGQHTINNLVVSCSKCNLSKSAKDPLEFANSIGKLF